MNNTRSGSSAFTLVEMLVVIAIVVIIASLVGPPASAMMKGMDLTQAGQTISDQLAMARQKSLARNNPVEVRFYQFAVSGIPGETTGTASTGKYRALQLFEILPSGRALPLDKMVRLPASTIFDSGGTLSTLLDANANPSLQKSWTTTDPQVSLPNVGVSYACRAFRFYPDGSTNLPKPAADATAATLFFCTLHNLNEGDALPQPKANFATLQVDVYNGHIKTFRP